MWQKVKQSEKNENIFAEWKLVRNLCHMGREYCWLLLIWLVSGIHGLGRWCQWQKELSLNIWMLEQKIQKFLVTNINHNSSLNWPFHYLSKTKSVIQVNQFLTSKIFSRRKKLFIKGMVKDKEKYPKSLKIKKQLNVKKKKLGFNHKIIQTRSKKLSPNWILLFRKKKSWFTNMLKVIGQFWEWKIIF